MTAEYLIEKATAFLSGSRYNRVSEEEAIREDLAGMQIYDEPLFGFADAKDPFFSMLKCPDIVHPDAMMPEDWLANAKTVISFFCPSTETVRHANAMNMKETVDEWLHARTEGQGMVDRLGRFIVDLLADEGCGAVYPAADSRFKLCTPYASNWSERHIAYIAGLGTFGLSKGLITEKGVAGRLGSVVTSCVFPFTERAYTGEYDYCIRCGSCQSNCPIDAIDLERGLDRGKDHVSCEAFLYGEMQRPPQGKNGVVRYGCGKCQVKVPCESRIPVAGIVND